MVPVPLPSPGRGNAAYLIVSVDGGRILAVWEDMLWAIDARSLQIVDALKLLAPVDGMSQSVGGGEFYLLPATTGNLAVNARGMFAVDPAALELRRHAEDWPALRIPFFFVAPAAARR